MKTSTTLFDSIVIFISHENVLVVLMSLRVNDYISSGLDKDLIDPDGGVNAEKKKAELGLLSKNKDNVPLELKQFPDKGFEVGLSRIPTIGYSQIWKYLIEDVELKRQLSVEKPIVKGYNFYRSGKVLGLYSQQINGVQCIKSQVMPSYVKTGAAYTVKIIVEANGNILKAHCPCPAGADGRCNHLATTLLPLRISKVGLLTETQLKMFLVPPNHVSGVFHQSDAQSQLQFKK